MVPPMACEVFVAEQAEPVLWRGKIARHVLKRGDVARMITGVGGGYGDPHERPVAEVLEDLQEWLHFVGNGCRIVRLSQT